MQTQRFSYQRQQIYAALCENHAHPTAEMIYVSLKPALPRLSLGTVYRNLHQMAQEGRLVELPGPVARFDADTKKHTHFQCSRCGSVLDLRIPYDAALDERAAAEEGAEICGHTLMFYGICSACAGKNMHESTEKRDF